MALGGGGGEGHRWTVEFSPGLRWRTRCVLKLLVKAYANQVSVSGHVGPRKKWGRGGVRT